MRTSLATSCLASVAFATTLLLLGGVPACGSSSSGSPEAPGDSGAPVETGGATETGTTDAGAKDVAVDHGPFTQAAHAPFPQVVYQGGGVVTAPKLVTVTFPGDTMAPQLDAFGASVASSSWWNAVRAGYCESDAGPCVGDGPAGVSVALTTAPAQNYTDSSQGGPSTLQTWLLAEIMSGALPKPDANAITNTIYLIYFPSTTTVNLDGSPSCMGFDGYHGSATLGSQQVVYAVIDECPLGPPPPPGSPTNTLLQETTLTAAHEIAEAATDPSNLALGYYLDLNDPSTWGWSDVEGGGEVADLCVDVFGLNQDETPDGMFTAQRIWSNAHAAAGGDPCNPLLSPGEVYFNAAPKESIFVVDVGKSVTFDVEAFSTGPMADWNLSAQDWSPYMTSPYLTFSIAGAMATDAGPTLQVNNGTSLKVTVTLTQDPGDLITNDGLSGADGALVSSVGDPNNPTAATYWPFIVLSPADAADSGIDAAVSTMHRPPGAGRTHRAHRSWGAGAERHLLRTPPG
jgi:hypothetical protein